MGKIIERGYTEVIEGVAHRHPTIIECCGEQIQCWNFTNTCDICGADYNWAGQRLAPRSQWGEETGEHWSEIIDIDQCSIEELLEGY